MRHRFPFDRDVRQLTCQRKIGFFNQNERDVPTRRYGSVPGSPIASSRGTRTTLVINRTRDESMGFVDQNIASWNRIADWLRHVEGRPQAA